MRGAAANSIAALWKYKRLPELVKSAAAPRPREDNDSSAGLETQAQVFVLGGRLRERFMARRIDCGWSEDAVPQKWEGN